MSSIKYPLTVFLISLTCSAFSQSNAPVFLKWKLRPGETITYKTIMQEVDTANRKDFSMSGFGKLMGDSVNADMQKVFKQLSEQTRNMSNFITYLKETHKNIVDIEMYDNNKIKDTGTDTGKMADEMKGLREIMLKNSGGITLRGAVYEDGKIQSFYTKNDQKNLLATLFELPGKPVKVGDTWSPDVHFLSMDENFVADSAFKKNVVTVANIGIISGEHIVTMNYDIEEYVAGDFKSPFEQGPVKMTMKMTHKAVANFSIETGRWINYEGVMSLSSTGLMGTQTTKKISLQLQ